MDEGDRVEATGRKIENSSPPQKHVQSPQFHQARTDPYAIFSDVYNYPWQKDSEFQSGLSAILQNTGERTSEGETHPDTDLLLQAQCFYYSRKYNLPAAIDVAAYKSWLNAQEQGKPAAGPSQELLLHCERLGEPPQNHSSSEDQASPLPRHQANLSSSPISPAPPSISSESFPSPSPQVPISTDPSNRKLILEPQQISQQPSNPQAPEPPYPTTFASIVDLITRNQPIPGIEQIPDTVLDASLSAPNKTPRRRKPWEKEEADLDDAVSAGGGGGDKDIADDYHDEDKEKDEDECKGLSTGKTRTYATEWTNGTDESTHQQQQQQEEEQQQDESINKESVNTA